MKFAKPPQGFNVIVREKLKRRIEKYSAEFPRFNASFAALKKRLSQTGHKEGTVLSGDTGPAYVFKTNLLGEVPTRTLLVLYRIIGTDLIIESMIIK